ncbi:MAG: hypothetical protein RIN55_06240 [Tissierellaceae bacterium]|nr:hypothetical protein [Tissierellaceae bacterium]
MNKLTSLIKVDLKNTYGISSIRKSITNKKNIWITIIIGLSILSLLPSYYFMVKGLGSLYDTFFQIGQGSYLLHIGIFASQLIIFVFGLMYVMSKYYFASDLNQLVPLPIKPSCIIGSKFVTLMISEYLTSLPIILPFIIIYGMKSGEGILYWIYSLLLTFTLPIIPLVIASLLVMFFMKYTNIGGKKDLIRIIGAVIFIVIAIWFQFTIQKIAMNSVELGEEFFISLAKDSQFLVKKLGIVFPPSMWATLALANVESVTGLSYLSLYLGVSAISLFIVILLSETIFFDGLIGNIEVVASKGKKKIKDMEKSVGVTKPYIALAKKELIMLFKTPVYLLNSIGGVIIVPVLLVMSYVTGEESMKPMIELLDTYPHLLTLAAVGMIVFLGIVNCIGATTFSREGKNLWIQRVLPIKARDQVIGRVLSSLVVQLIGIFALILAIFFIKKISLMDILIIIVVGLLGSITMTQIGMVIDIARPMLIWDNPQRAMKQNFNVIISMGVATLVIAGLFFLVKSLLLSIDIGYIYIILSSIFVITAIILHSILVKLIDRQFMDLE